MLIISTQERCRICLEKTESHFPLHKKVLIDEDNVVMLEILRYCGKLEVLYNDRKPQNVCSVCIESAKVAYRFKLMCMQSETTLNTEILNKIINQRDPLEFLKEEGIIEIGDVEVHNIKDEEPNPNNAEDASDEPEENNDCLDNYDDVVQEENSMISSHTNEDKDEKIHNIKDIDKHVETNDCYDKRDESNYDDEVENINDNAQQKESNDNVESVGQTKQDDQNIKCLKCDEGFFNQQNLKVHMLNHTVGEKHINEKQKEIEGNNVVKKTRKIKEKNHSCPQCSKSFRYHVEMRQHLCSHDKTEKKCPYCDFKGSGIRIGWHMNKNHDDRKTIQCSDCNKRFFQQKNLIRHAVIHTGVKNYACDVCSMCFMMRSNLVIHRRVHTGEKPYKCGTCGSAFAQHSTLHSHESTHFKGPKYTCELCNKVFERKDGLRKHMYTHADARPYPCSLCDKRFRTYYYLNRHMNTHTGEQIFKCDVCSKEFNRKCNLQAHMKTHKGEK